MAVNCSFCLKRSDEVTRMLAGAAGVHICEQCVGACNAILADPSVPFPDFEGDDDEALLARLRPASEQVEASAAGLRGLVDLLRRREVSWARIGDALGVSRQAAWERFG